MNLQETLAALEHASMSLKSADARRIISEIACSLRVTGQRHNKVQILNAKLGRLATDTSNQAAAQIGSIKRELECIGEVDLHEAIRRAQNELKTWEGH